MRWEWSLWAQWSRPGPPGRAWLLCWARRRPRRWWRWGRRECRSGWGSSPLTSQTGSHTRGGSSYLATHQSQFYHSLLSLSCRKWNGWNMFLAAVTRLQAENIKCDKISRQTHDYIVRDTQRLRWEHVMWKYPSHSKCPLTHLWINWPRWFSVCVRGPWTAGGWRPPTPERCWGRHSTCTWCPPWCSRLKQQTWVKIKRKDFNIDRNLRFKEKENWANL